MSNIKFTFFILWAVLISSHGISSALDEEKDFVDAQIKNDYGTQEDYAVLASCLAQMAAKFYQLICEEKIFGESGKEYDRALLAAYYLLHENHIGFIDQKELDLGLENVLGIFHQRIIKTLTANLKDLSTRYKNKYGFMVSEYTTRLFCDHASEIVDAYPESEQEIYGFEPKDKARL